VKGRKRHILVDVMGLLLGCYVSAANVADGKAAPALLVPVLELYQRIEKVLADQGYRGETLANQVQTAYNCVLEVVQPPQKENSQTESSSNFMPQPLRWVVERTFAWLDNARILCRDYETLPEMHEGMIYVVMVRLMLRRLCNNRRTRLEETS
jgi:putative transposase